MPHLLEFLTVAGVICVTPGPDMALVTRKALREGPHRGGALSAAVEGWRMVSEHTGQRQPAGRAVPCRSCGEPGATEHGRAATPLPARSTQPPGFAPPVSGYSYDTTSARWVSHQIHHETCRTMYVTRRSPFRWGRVVFPASPSAVLGQAFTTSAPARRNVGMPLPLDIRQTEDAYVVEASVPGFTPEEVEVTVDGNWLVIRADHSEDREGTEAGWVRRERRSTSVYRRLALPEQTDVDAISASVANGELSISVPRSRVAEPHRIPVTAPVAAGPAAETPQTAGETA